MAFLLMIFLDFLHSFTLEWVPNKLLPPLHLLISEFFSNSPNAHLDPLLIYYFLFTCTEIENLNTNILILKFQ